MTISILFIHHVGTFGGASRSLLELMQGLPEDAVSPHLLVPRGNVASFFTAAGVPVMVTTGISQFDNTRFGYYRGKRWLLLLREACFLPVTILAMLRARRQWQDIDLIHVNEVVAIPTIILAKWLFAKPVVVHVRSVQRTKTADWRYRMIQRVLGKYSDAIIAIDETVRRSLGSGLGCEVIHNSFSPHYLAGDMPRRGTMQQDWSTTNPMRVAIVGNLLLLKGIVEFVDAALLCRDRHRAIEFLIVGSNTRRLTGIAGWLLKRSGFAPDVEAHIKTFIAKHNLENTVRLLGFKPNIDEAYRDLNVLCFPSHLNAVGRPVYEAAFWGIPSIVALHDPLPDTMVDHETGLCIEPGNVKALADAIDYFYTHPDEIKRMGDAAHRLANTNCNSRSNAARMLCVYRRLTGLNIDGGTLGGL